MADFSVKPGFSVRLADNLAIATSGSFVKSFAPRREDRPITSATVLYRKASGTGTLQVRLIARTPWGTDIVLATGAEADLKVTLPSGYALKELRVELRETGALAGLTADAEVILG